METAPGGMGIASGRLSSIPIRHLFVFARVLMKFESVKIRVFHDITATSGALAETRDGLRKRVSKAFSSDIREG